MPDIETMKLHDAKYAVSMPRMIREQNAAIAKADATYGSCTRYGPIRATIWGIIGLICYSIYQLYHTLSAWNRS